MTTEQTDMERWVDAMGDFANDVAAVLRYEPDPVPPYTPIPRTTACTSVCCAPPEVTARWIAATDPAPVEPPPEPVTAQSLDEFLRSDLDRELRDSGASAQAAASRLFHIPADQIVIEGPGLRFLSDPGDPGRAARIRTILNATRRAT